MSLSIFITVPRANASHISSRICYWFFLPESALVPNYNHSEVLSAIVQEKSQRPDDYEQFKTNLTADGLFSSSLFKALLGKMIATENLFNHRFYEKAYHPYYDVKPPISLEQFGSNVATQMERLARLLKAEPSQRQQHIRRMLFSTDHLSEDLEWSRDLPQWQMLYRGPEFHFAKFDDAYSIRPKVPIITEFEFTETLALEFERQLQSVMRTPQFLALALSTEAYRMYSAIQSLYQISKDFYLILDPLDYGFMTVKGSWDPGYGKATYRIVEDHIISRPAGSEGPVQYDRGSGLVLDPRNTERRIDSRKLRPEMRDSFLVEMNTEPDLSQLELWNLGDYAKSTIKNLEFYGKDDLRSLVSQTIKLIDLKNQVSPAEFQKRISEVLEKLSFKMILIQQKAHILKTFDEKYLLEALKAFNSLGEQLTDLTSRLEGGQFDDHPLIERPRYRENRSIKYINGEAYIGFGEPIDTFQKADVDILKRLITLQFEWISHNQGSLESSSEEIQSLLSALQAEAELIQAAISRIHQGAYQEASENLSQLLGN